MIAAAPAATAPTAGRGFDALFAEFTPRVRGLVRRLIPDADLVDDIVQETFLRAYSARLHEEDGSDQWPWLATVARNAALDAIRRRRRNTEQTLDDGEAPPVSVRGNPEDELLRALGYAQVTRALAAVPGRHRRILVLKHLDGWRYDEIAAAEGLSFEALKSALARARRKFLKEYEAISHQPLHHTHESDVA